MTNQLRWHKIASIISQLLKGLLQSEDCKQSKLAEPAGKKQLGGNIRILLES
jgi:hypothetical protein